MATHVAILLRPYLRLILEGRKTIESRFTLRPLPPYCRIAPGDTIFFKASAGPYMARARAGSVKFFEDLTVAEMRKIYRAHNHAIRGAPEFWQTKKYARYGTLIWLQSVQATDQGPAIAPSRGPAWFVLDEVAIPAAPLRPRPQPHGESFAVTLTAGAIRNHYLTLPASLAATSRGRRLTLRLPDHHQITTDLVGSRLRWRRWNPYFRHYHVKPGRRIQLTASGPFTYTVTFLP